MKIRYCSDLHLDFDHKKNPQNLWLPPPLEDDSETTLVIAGDIWTEGRQFNLWTHNVDLDFSASWMKVVSEQFKYVVFVHGNHDYYKARFDTLSEKVRVEIKEQEMNNVFLLDCDVIELDGITFVGGCMWSNYGNRDAISMMEAVNYMNDYRLIRVGEEYRKLKPVDCLKVFDKTKALIFKTAKECKEAGKPCVVITHMAPSYQSVNEKYRNKRDELSNTWYYSELSSYIVDSGIAYWIHGHMHDANIYVIDKTIVLCNPRGYVGYEANTGFNDVASVTVSTNIIGE